MNIADLRRTCRTCEGGIVYSPAWSAWMDRHPDWMDQARATPAPAGPLFPDDPEPDEPEEIPCSECDGRGTVLTTEGAQLVAFLSQFFARVS